MRKYFAAVILVLVMILGGCAAKGTVGSEEVVQNKNIQTPPAQPITITDFAGRTVTLQRTPQKIISLSPAVTEILYAMGYGDKIIAVSEETTYPADSAKKAKVGKYADVDIDAIEKASPDIVFASKYIYKTIAESLEKMDIPVVYAEAENYNGIFDSIDLIGKIFRDKNKTAELSNSIKQEITQIREGENPQRPNVLYIQSLEPLYVAGSDTLINDEIWLAGGANSAQDVNGYGEEDKAAVLAKKVDIIVLSNKLAEQGINLNYLKGMDGFKDIDAVKNGKVYTISDEELAETPGVRITKAIEEMKGIISK